RSASQAASPAVARMTTARFIRLGPAPISPRSPAVPNSRRAPNRSASAARSGPPPPPPSRPASPARASGPGRPRPPPPAPRPRGPQPGGAELEAGAGPVGPRRQVGLAALPAQQRVELGPGLGVGVLVPPGPRRRHQPVAVHRGRCYGHAPGPASEPADDLGE